MTPIAAVRYRFSDSHTDWSPPTLAKKDSKIDFETALNELEQLVGRLEQGDLSLEESLKDFERGIELTRTCQTALKEAEQKIHILTQKSEDAELQPLDDEDS